MEYCFESIKRPTANDCIVGVFHINNVKHNLFSPCIVDKAEVYGHASASVKRPNKVPSRCRSTGSTFFPRRPQRASTRLHLRATTSVSYVPRCSMISLLYGISAPLSPSVWPVIHNHTPLDVCFEGRRCLRAACQEPHDMPAIHFQGEV